MKEKIQTERAPQASGPYSQAIRVGNTVYFAGQIPLDPETMNLVSDSFQKQAEQVFINLNEVVKAAGGTLDNIVKLNVYLRDLTNFSFVNEVMVRYFVEPYPVRTTIEVSALPKNSQIEIDAVMVI